MPSEATGRLQVWYKAFVVLGQEEEEEEEEEEERERERERERDGGGRDGSSSKTIQNIIYSGLLKCIWMKRDGLENPQKTDLDIFFNCSGSEVIKCFPSLTQLSMKFQMLIKNKIIKKFSFFLAQFNLECYFSFSAEQSIILL